MLANDLLTNLAPKDRGNAGQISKQTVDRLPLGSLVWDTTLVGFGVRRQRKSAFYLVRYRINKRQRFFTIGRHGPWTPDAARREAQRLLGIVATGADPADQKAQLRSFGAKSDQTTIRRLSLTYEQQKPRFGIANPQMTTFSDSSAATSTIAIRSSMSYDWEALTIESGFRGWGQSPSPITTRWRARYFIT